MKNLQLADTRRKLKQKEIELSFLISSTQVQLRRLRNHSRLISLREYRKLKLDETDLTQALERAKLESNECLTNKKSSSSTDQHRPILRLVSSRGQS